MDRKDIRAQILQTGIIASIRVPSAEDARFASETVSQGGIPIIEIATTIPGAIRVISELVKSSPETIVGAGSVLDAETARRCVDAGASFLTTDGVVMEVIERAKIEDVVIFPGALTPGEIIRHGKPVRTSSKWSPARRWAAKATLRH
jgi:2-dehydro-3-deoxyphosphogluconate aldolase/(4S)-4-hydroxy-2-oxoglutarate aldolase